MRFLLGVLMLMISGSALATIDVLQFKDEAQEQQFRQLTEELRCQRRPCQVQAFDAQAGQTKQDAEEGGAQAAQN